jgi:hypothetical protein
MVSHNQRLATPAQLRKYAKKQMKLAKKGKKEDRAFSRK